MKWIILALLFLFSCGKPKTSSVVGLPGVDGYTPIATATIHITQRDGVASYSLINVAYAATAAVNYVLAPNTTFTIANNISPILTDDVLDIGTVAISALSTNNLKVCNTNQKCNRAAIRIYTQGAISGLVNTADAYGVPLLTGASTVGLTPLVLEEIVIPVNKNKLTLSDFTNLVHDLTADFSNAGAGNYEATLVIELALAKL